MTEKSHRIYIFDDENFLVLDPEESVGYSVPDKPHFFTWVSAYKCQKCGQIMILSGDAELVGTDEREMGKEYFYHDENYLDCPQCKQKIAIEIGFSEYATGWFCEEDNSGIDEIGIDGLEWLAEEYFNSIKALREKEALEGVGSRLTHQLKELVEIVEKKRMYVLIVEGKDDRAIWEQFLLKEGIPLDLVDIPVYGEGGLNEAVKLATVFRLKRLKMVPHKLMLDSDNDIKSTIEKLEKNGIEKSDYHILKEKEIESYIIDEDAIARVVSVNVEEIRAFNEKLKGAIGKERLEKIVAHFTGHPPNSQAKGLIARALQKIPQEIMSILEEIRASLMKEEASQFFAEDY